MCPRKPTPRGAAPPPRQPRRAGQHPAPAGRWEGFTAGGPRKPLLGRAAPGEGRAAPTPQRVLTGHCTSRRLSPPRHVQAPGAAFRPAKRPRSARAGRFPHPPTPHPRWPRRRQGGRGTNRALRSRGLGAARRAEGLPRPSGRPVTSARSRQGRGEEPPAVQVGKQTHKGASPAPARPRWKRRAGGRGERRRWLPRPAVRPGASAPSCTSPPPKARRDGSKQKPEPAGDAWVGRGTSAPGHTKSRAREGTRGAGGGGSPHPCLPGRGVSASPACPGRRGAGGRG